MKTLANGEFTLEACETSYKGYFDPMIYWNGWRIPFFEYEVMKEIFKELDDIHVTENDGVFTVDLELTIHTFYPEILTVNNKEITVYSMEGWIWSETEKHTEEL